jgi:hypothetical protein
MEPEVSKMMRIFGLTVAWDDPVRNNTEMTSSP